MPTPKSATGTNYRGRSARAVVRYGLLQLAGVTLLALFLMLVRRWFDIPVWLVWGFLALWVAKDVILYPLVRRCYNRDKRRDQNPMLGARGIAKDRLAPSGYILMDGELWQAEVMEGSQPIQKEESVVARGTRGLTLSVEPDSVETRHGDGGGNKRREIESAIKFMRLCVLDL